MAISNYGKVILWEGVDLVGSYFLFVFNGVKHEELMKQLSSLSVASLTLANSRLCFSTKVD
jgi:hypothetical protein